MVFISVEPVMFLFVLCFAGQFYLSQDFLFTRLCQQKFGHLPICDTSQSQNTTNVTLSVAPHGQKEASVASLGQRGTSVASLGQHGDGFGAADDEIKKIQSEVVLMWMIWNIVYTVVSIVMAQIFGFFMDRYSKKALMLFPLVGQIFTIFGFVLISSFVDAPILVIYALPLIGGLTGGFVTLKGAIMSYMVQIHQDGHKRTSHLSILEGAFFAGGSCGLFLLRTVQTHVTKQYGYLYLGIMGILTLTLLYTMFVLPDISIESTTNYCAPIQTDGNCKSSVGCSASQETVEATAPDEHLTSSLSTSLGRERRLASSNPNLGYQSFDRSIENSHEKSFFNGDRHSIHSSMQDYDAASTTNLLARSTGVLSTKFNSSASLCLSDDVLPPENVTCCRVFTDALRTTFRKRPNGIRAMIIANMIANFLSLIVFSAETDLSYIYLREKVGWSFDQFLEYFGSKTACDGASLLLLLPFCRMFLNLSDATLGIIGGISRTAFFVYLGLVYIPSRVYWGIVINIFGFYALVVSKSLMSKMVLESEQGRVLTVLSSLEQISAVIGSFTFDSLYSYFLKRNIPGVTMLIAAGSGALVTVIYCCLYFALLVKDYREPNEPSNDENRPLLQERNLARSEDHLPSTPRPLEYQSTSSRKFSTRSLSTAKSSSSVARSY